MLASDLLIGQLGRLPRLLRGLEAKWLIVGIDVVIAIPTIIANLFTLDQIASTTGSVHFSLLTQLMQADAEIGILLVAVFVIQYELERLAVERERARPRPTPRSPAETGQDEHE